MTADDLVGSYLSRLGVAAAALPPDRRADLLDGIAEHIDGARAAGAAADEAAVRTLLDRLGTPEEIVAAASEDAPPVVTRPRGTGRELTAVLLMTIGSFVPPVVGWVAGVVLLWTSPLWRVREKLLGTLVWPLGPGGALIGGGILSSGLGFADEQCTTLGDVTTCTGSGSAIGVGELLLLLVLPVLVAVYLYRVAVRRARELPPVPVTGAPSPWGGQEVAGVLLLGLGGLLFPVVPAVVGLVLVLASRRWTRREKVVGGLLAGTPLLLGLVGLALYYVTQGAVSVGPAELSLLGGYFALLVGPVISAVYLSVVLSRRA